jgi:hypothetical protein
VEQQSEQRALCQPQQERTTEQEQQRGVSVREHSVEIGQDAAVAGNGDGG